MLTADETRALKHEALEAGIQARLTNGGYAPSNGGYAPSAPRGPQAKRAGGRRQRQWELEAQREAERARAAAEVEEMEKVARRARRRAEREAAEANHKLDREVSLKVAAARREAEALGAG